MVIKGKVSDKKYLTINDLPSGTVFVIAGEHEIYLKTNKDIFVEIISGTVLLNETIQDKPVRKLNALLNISDN